MKFSPVREHVRTRIAAAGHLFGLQWETAMRLPLDVWAVYAGEVDAWREQQRRQR